MEDANELIKPEKNTCTTYTGLARIESFGSILKLIFTQRFVKSEERVKICTSSANRTQPIFR